MMVNKLNRSKKKIVVFTSTPVSFWLAKPPLTNVVVKVSPTASGRNVRKKVCKETISFQIEARSCKIQYLEVSIVGKLLEVPSDTEYVYISGSWDIGTRIIQRSQAGRSDGGTAACRDSDTGYRCNQIPLDVSRERFDVWLQEARSLHLAHITKVCRWSYDIDMRVKDAWQRVTQGADDI